MVEKKMRVATTELSRHFSEYLARVRFGGTTVIVLKNRSPVAELRALPAEDCTAEDLFEVLQSLGSDESLASDLEKVNEADMPLENPWD